MPKKKTSSKKKRPRGHRPSAKIDLIQLEQLCGINCTAEEIATFFKVSTKTIERRRKVEAFAAVMERGYASGRITIRRMQMKLASAGNPTMLIWLGKQLLGQADTQKLEHSGTIEMPDLAAILRERYEKRTGGCE